MLWKCYTGKVMMRKEDYTEERGRGKVRTRWNAPATDLRLEDLKGPYSRMFLHSKFGGEPI